MNAISATTTIILILKDTNAEPVRLRYALIAAISI